MKFNKIQKGLQKSKDDAVWQYLIDHSTPLSNILESFLE